MLTPIALILSIVFQLIAVVMVIGLIKGSKYNSSWILLSVGLSMMAFRRLYELVNYYHVNMGETATQLNNWLGVLISILIVIGVFYMRKVFTYMEMMQQMRQESEKKVLSAIINTEESERKRMANELHDGLGPLLSTIKMSMYALAPAENKKHERSIYDNTMASVDEAIASLREIANNLSPSVLEDFGLLAAIRSFINKTETVADFKIELATNLNDNMELNKETSLILYRALCELIHNTLKHAGAQKIMISLYLEGNTIMLLYQDDGIGFNYDSPMKQEPWGMGLHTIQSRVASVAGRFELTSRPGEGVMVKIQVNMKQDDKN